MVREYTNREVSPGSWVPPRRGHYRLIPIVAISRDQVRVRFTVGREKQYPVKDLTAFAKAMENMSLVQYGKGLAFHHSLQAFDEKSRALALLIMERVGFFREQYRGSGRFSMEAEPALKELILGRAGRERFFAIMDGQTIECEDYRKKKRMLTGKTGKSYIYRCCKERGTGRDQGHCCKGHYGLFRRKVLIYRGPGIDLPLRSRLHGVPDRIHGIHGHGGLTRRMKSPSMTGHAALL